jgi:hypothetical protein
MPRYKPKEDFQKSQSKSGREKNENVSPIKLTRSKAKTIILFTKYQYTKK